MKIQNQTNTNNMTFGIFNKRQMGCWRKLNDIKPYVNAAYEGYTGIKTARFPTVVPIKYRSATFIPDVTDDLYLFEEKVFQDLKETKEKPFGKIRALWKMCRNFGTGEAWDTKFLPEFPGRDINGRKQYAKYNGEIVSGNDISNIFYAHTCKFVGVPQIIAKLCARLDACGILEPLSKGKLPSLKLLKFRDTASDQLAINKGIQDFDMRNYRLL